MASLLTRCLCDPYQGGIRSAEYLLGHHSTQGDVGIIAPQVIEGVQN